MKISFMQIVLRAFFFVVLFFSHTYGMDAKETSRLVLSFGSAKATCGRRCLSEDRCCIATNPDLPFFGLFDGHNGDKAAEIARIKLYGYLREACVNEFGMDLSDTNIISAFAKTQQDILGLRNNDSGSTAVAVFFNQVKGTHDPYLHVAHIGDSRALLGTKDGGFRELTHDHRPDNQLEIDRIRKFNLERRKRSQGQENWVAPAYRPSKASCGISRKLDFGSSPGPTPLQKCDHEEERGETDFRLNLQAVAQNLAQEPNQAQPKPRKKITPGLDNWELKTGLAVTRCFGHTHLAKKGLICTPDLSHILIEEHHKFLIEYSDGVGDHLSPERMAALVNQQVSDGYDLSTIAHNLIIEAARHDLRNINHDNADIDILLRGIKDDMTIIIILLSRQ